VAVLFNVLKIHGRIPGHVLLLDLYDERFCLLKNAVFWDVTWRNIPEDGILPNHRHKNLKSYTFLFSLLWFVVLLL
jgi:hypothetical protein